MTPYDQHTTVRRSRPARTAEEGRTPVEPTFSELDLGRDLAWRKQVGLRVQEARHLGLAPAHAHLRWRQDRSVRPVRVRPGLGDASVVVVMVVKDEAPRMPYFIDYYRRLGVEHFVVIDNASSDGLQSQLSGQFDVTVFESDGDYKASGYGRDWVNRVLHEHCTGKWVSWLDADELLVFSAGPSTTLPELGSALERAGRRSLNVLMVDMYSSASPSTNVVGVGEDPLAVCDLFDGAGYVKVRGLGAVGGLGAQQFWIKGGVRGRLFFPRVSEGPALNKSAMIRWRPHTVFLRGAHELWPYRLNGDGRLGGVLLHFKFTAVSASKMLDADVRQQHTAEYAAYDQLDEIEFVDERCTRRYVDADSVISAGLFTPVV